MLGEFARVDEQLLAAEDGTDGVESANAELKPHSVSNGRDILKVWFIDWSCLFSWVRPSDCQSVGLYR